MEDLSKYSHSPVHLAVLRRDYSALREIIRGFPRLPKAGEVNTEAESIAAAQDADKFSAVVDRRDVPGCETPMYLAVRLKDAQSVELLMEAGTDWTLQNENGWNAFQEAVCNGEDQITKIIARLDVSNSLAKWCCRIPRIIASIARMRDFYMEISFQFESSVIPFIGRIAPSDTYRVWKRGSNARVDMTLAGFDGFRIQRSDQTFLFFGDGHSPDNGSRSLPSGSLIVLTHEDKKVTNALEEASVLPSEDEVTRMVESISKLSVYRPGIDVTRAELAPRLNWRRQERTEMVGNWNAKIYDMLNVMVSVKLRRAPRATADKELFAVDEADEHTNGVNNDDLDGILTAEERKQLVSALKTDDLEDSFLDEDNNCKDCLDNGVDSSFDKGMSNGTMKGIKNAADSPADSINKILELSFSPETQNDDLADTKKRGDKSSKKKQKKGTSAESKREREYKKGVRPALWLTPDFPLKMEELLPVLDIFANKVKAVRRLREILTTKLPQGTFPVKVAIPIVPTIKVIATFTQFEDLEPTDEFLTPPSSPTHFQDAKSGGSTSWVSWARRKSGRGQSSDSSGSRDHIDDVDPFHIPSDYIWVDPKEKNPCSESEKTPDQEESNASRGE